VLHRRCVGRGADLAQKALARVPVARADPDLDQLLARERALDLGEHRPRETALADPHDRIEAMRACLERLSVGRGERLRHPPDSIDP